MRRLLSSILLATATTAAAAAPAFAQDAAVAGASDTAPGFTNINSASDGSKVEASLDVLVPIGDNDDEGVLTRTNLLGQFVTPGGAGGYVAIHATKLVGQEGDEDFASLGNLELGGLFHKQIDAATALGFRFGAILPTRTGDDFTPFVDGIYTQVARPGEIATAVSDAVWLRANVTPTFRQGIFFARADLGMDLPVTERDQLGVDGIAHLNLGAGIQQGAVSVTGELQTAYAMGVEKIEDREPERFVHTAGASVRYQSGKVAPFAAVSTPVDDDFRGDLMTFTIGLSGQL
jgi:hypothetical protein